MFKTHISTGVITKLCVWNLDYECEIYFVNAFRLFSFLWGRTGGQNLFESNVNKNKGDISQYPIITYLWTKEKMTICIKCTSGRFGLAQLCRKKFKPKYLWKFILKICNMTPIWGAGVEKSQENAPAITQRTACRINFISDIYNVYEKIRLVLSRNPTTYFWGANKGVPGKIKCGKVKKIFSILILTRRNNRICLMVLCVNGLWFNYIL